MLEPGGAVKRMVNRGQEEYDDWYWSKLFNYVNNNTKILSKSSSRVPVVSTNEKNTRSWVWSDASALWRFLFCCTGSLICYDHKSFLPGTILLKCKFVSPSSHQPTGLDNKFSPERFVEMKRPVIFRCCELLFFFLLLSPIFTVNIQFKKKKKKKKYWQAGGLDLLSLAFTRRITARKHEKYKRARSHATWTLSRLSCTPARRL